MAAALRTGDLLLDMTTAVSMETFARLARSQDFYRSTRPETKMTKSEVLELGDWVLWEFQTEDHEAPSDSENCEEVVPNPPPGVKVETTAPPPSSGAEGGAVEEGERDECSPSATTTTKTRASNEKDSEGNTEEADEKRPQQMYRKVRLRSTVSSPLGTSHNDVVQGQTLREGKGEVIYTETDCVKGLPMFKGDMAIKTTYRVTRDESDPDNSVHVKVTAFLRDVKLVRAMGWLSRLIGKSIKDSAKKQAAQNLSKMAQEAKTA
eukprot:g19521.t1